jgi:hypothetical protein
MATDHRKVSEQLAQEILLEDPKFLRDIIERVLQETLEAEMTEHIGAAPYERSATRTGHRNDYKSRTLRLFAPLAHLPAFSLVASFENSHRNTYSGARSRQMDRRFISWGPDEARKLVTENPRGVKTGLRVSLTVQSSRDHAVTPITGPRSRSA